MIVVDENDDLLLVTQPDHAHLAAEILSLCRFPDLIGNPRRDQILRATREHDNGWQELDAAPPVDASGRPYAFTALPDAMRRELWTRGIDRFRSSDPYVALLILQHSLEIHSDRREHRSWDEWFETVDALRSDLLEVVAIEPARLEADYIFLRFADLASLAVCTRSSQTFEYAGTTGRWNGSELLLDPFPLAGTTSFRLACRRVSRRSYPTTVAFGAELAPARWEARTVRVAAAGP